MAVLVQNGSVINFGTFGAQTVVTPRAHQGWKCGACHAGTDDISHDSEWRAGTVPRRRH